MGQWKIIVGKESKNVTSVATKETRKATYYQIITHDDRCYAVGDYEIIEKDKVRFTSKGELPADVVEIGGKYYSERGEQKFMSDFNGIIDVYIRNWRNARPQYDITDVKLAIKHFKELMALKNELLGLK
jgi:hypothetical protein